MIGDRDYMREGRYRAPMSLTAILTITLVVVFALQCINDVYLRGIFEYWLALTPYCLSRGWVWQLFTFQFLHGDLLHIVFNLIAFWWLGRFCENVLGKSRFLVAYFGCGAAGGVLQGLLMLAFPLHFGSHVVGASAGVSGLLAIFALLLQGQEVRFNFVLPMRAIVLLYISLGIALFFTLVPSGRGGLYAHAAHLGGMLAGIAWVKLGWHHDYIRLPWEKWLDAWRERRARRPVRLPHGLGNATAAAAARSRKESAERSGPTEFISKEVDPILDKISAHGIQSLTERERKILEAARAKMAKR
ncbi:MAG TPA: rhomboid family intramembrane serine protease [Verrucomicrobiae bacterium]|nr:rhomboid family intramembrane serine protease [Verrucomicrobiae bacterium]